MEKKVRNVDWAALLSNGGLVVAGIGALFVVAAFLVGQSWGLNSNEVTRTIMAGGFVSVLGAGIWVMTRKS